MCFKAMLLEDAGFIKESQQEYDNAKQISKG
jgi:hypothetical protein